MASKKAPSNKKAKAPQPSNVVLLSIRDMEVDKTRRDEDVMQFMSKGHKFTKVRGKGSKYVRTLTLDKDCVSFRMEGSTKSGVRKALRSKSKTDMSEIYISDIMEVREGYGSEVFTKSKKKRKIPEEQCFSIVIGAKHKTLDLIAQTPEVRDAWVRGLRFLTGRAKELQLQEAMELWVRELFKIADKDKSGYLTLKEVVDLCMHMNVQIDVENAKQLFEAVDFKKDDQEENLKKSGKKKKKKKRKENTLDEDEFFQFYKILSRRPEIEAIFEEHGDGKFLTIEQLKTFFREEQKMDVEDAYCLGQIELHESVPATRDMKKMSQDGFRTMLMSNEHEVMNPRHLSVYQDMDQPLSHYFIDSSHNTYLMEDQLVGPSKVEAYIRALNRGCRCVELDCWDGPDEEPVIYHGYTLTSKILFKDVIAAIKDYAFKASDYPVILSIENHCSVAQQNKMAKHMRKILGSKLYTTPISDDMTELPSPEFLKGKILVKGKKLPSGDNDGNVSDEDEAADVEDEAVKENLKKKSDESTKLSKDLSDTVVFCQSVHFKGFEHAKNNYNFAQMSSYSESKTMDLVESQPEQYVDLNTRQLSRIYPAGTRTDSSNYDPQPAWNCGCQIVALNYQTSCDSMQLNKGKFQDNGGCGYVLKPAFMRQSGIKFNPNGPFPQHWQRRLVIKVISGYHLPKPKGAGKKSICDPFVEVRIIGVPKDNMMFKTQVVQDNGFKPVWNEKFGFTVLCPELAVLRVIVKDYSSTGTNETLGQFTVPFNSIQSGWRVCPLKTVQCTSMQHVSLLLHLDIS